jgi:hypothetical protein
MPQQLTANYQSDKSEEKTKKKKKTPFSSDRNSRALIRRISYVSFELVLVRLRLSVPPPLLLLRLVGEQQPSLPPTSNRVRWLITIQNIL